ncbi:MAG: hypothetical protein P8X89_01790 [Reinekea sp.]
MDRIYCNPDNTEHYYYSQIHPENYQHASHSEVGQTSGGVVASGPSWSHPVPGQFQPYPNFNFPAQIPPLPNQNLDYFLSLPQPVAVEDIIQNDASLAPPQPVVDTRRRKACATPVKERFLAGLEAFGRGVLLKDCSSSLKFSNYITDDGKLVSRGIPLYGELTAAEKTRLDEAIIARQGAKFLRLADEDLVREHFLAGLDNYAQGVPLTDCSAALQFRFYASNDGRLQKAGKQLYNSLPSEEQVRIDQALLSRHDNYLKWSMNNPSLEERFLASLDNYARGVPLKECAGNIYLTDYLTAGGGLRSRGKILYDRFSPDDKARVNQALTTRKEAIAQSISEDVANVMKMLEPYGNGLPLQQCAKRLGLKRELTTYLTTAGGLTPKGERLVENMQPSQRNEVLNTIAKRQRCVESNISVFESSWQQPEMPASVQELGGMDPTAIVDPMQTEEMWTTVWQSTGQAVPGPSGADFQHQYGPY